MRAVLVTIGQSPNSIIAPIWQRILKLKHISHHFHNWTGTSGIHAHWWSCDIISLHKINYSSIFSSSVWCLRIGGVGGWVGYSDPGILVVAKKPTPYYKGGDVSYASRLRFQDILSFITGCNPGIKLVHIFRIQSILNSHIYYIMNWYGGMCKRKQWYWLYNHNGT